MSQPVATTFTRRRKFGVLLICTMSLLMVGLDASAVNVALPVIRHTLHAGVSGLQWVVAAYTMVLASLFLLSGSTADRFGRRRTFVFGLGIFGTGSLLCSLAPGLGYLVAFRMLQAVGGSMLTPVALSIVTNVFVEPKERAQAIGVWGSVVGISVAVGPAIGGFFVDTIGWRSIFWVNVPIAVAAAVLTLRYVPESKAERPRRADPPGQVAIVAFLASTTFVIIEFPGHGFGDPLVSGAAVLAVASLAAILVVEPRREEPLIDLRFFRSPPFSGAMSVGVATSVCFGGFLLMNTLYLQVVRDLSPLHAGIDTMPMAATAMATAPVSGRITAHRGGRLPMVVAGVLLAASFAVLAGMSATTPFSVLFACYVGFGAGYGLLNAAITTAAVTGMPRAQHGVAAAMATSCRLTGQTLGVAVSGALVTARLNAPLRLGLPDATHLGWVVLAACGAAIVVVGVVSTSARARASARRTAEALNPEAVEFHASLAEGGRGGL